MEGVNVFANAVRSGAPESRDAGSDLSAASVEGVKENEKGFAASGINAAKGYIQSIRSMYNEARSAGAGLGSASLKANAKTLQEKSPSRAFGEQGYYAVMGFVNNIMSNLWRSSDAGTALGDSALQSISDSVAYASDIFSDEIDPSPVITPVVNLDEMSSGIGIMRSMLNSNTMGLNPSLNLASNRMGLASQVSKGFDEAKLSEIDKFNMIGDNSDVVEAVGKLQDDISRLGQSMSQLKIVMDSGALVGEIVDPMDNALGRRSIYKGRGL
jgi:hypothetical protein